MWRQLFFCPTKKGDFIEVKMEYEDKDIADRKPEKVTYKMISSYVEEKYGFKVHTAYIAQVKRSLGLPISLTGSTVIKNRS